MRHFGVANSHFGRLNFEPLKITDLAAVGISRQFAPAPLGLESLADLICPTVGQTSNPSISAILERAMMARHGSIYGNQTTAAMPYVLLDTYTAWPYIPTMQTVLLTPTFERQAQRAGLSDAEVLEIASFIAADPTAGDLIKGSGGARKVRHARQGEGKSGGSRTIHFFGGDDIPVFLLAIIDKRERANLSKAEVNALAAVLSQIGDAYRRGERK